MTKDKIKALGKGLSSLIPNKSLLNIDNMQLRKDSLIEIPIDKIFPNSDQPRKFFRDNEILELSNSIKIYGILHPILVKKIKEDEYEIIAGERRWRAAKLANLKTIPSLITDLAEREKIEVSLIENIQREDLNPLEEAYIYKKLINEHNYTQEKLAEKIGKSRSYIANLIRLLKLPEKFKNLLVQDKLSAGHARLLLVCKEPDELVKIIQKNKLSVRQAENIIINENKKTLKNLTFFKKLKDPELTSLEKKIGKSLNLKTKINLGEKNNSITIRFDTMDEFDYLVSVLCRNSKNLTI